MKERARNLCKMHHHVCMCMRAICLCICQHIGVGRICAYAKKRRNIIIELTVLQEKNLHITHSHSHTVIITQSLSHTVIITQSLSHTVIITHSHYHTRRYVHKLYSHTYEIIPERTSSPDKQPFSRLYGRLFRQT
jgi:hypothetical protein